MRARSRSERGAELIEFALVLPLLMLIVLGIVDFGFLFQRMEVVTNAAREGARIGVLPGYGSTDICARVLDFVQNGGLPTTGTCPTPTNPTLNINTAYSIAMPTGSPIPGIRVEVAYTHQYVFIGPIMRMFGSGIASVPVRGVAIMRTETYASGS